MTKKVTLTGTEQEVTFAGTHTYYWVQCLSGGDILAGFEPDLAEDKDDVLIVQRGGVGRIHNDFGKKTIYLSGTGKVQVIGTNNAFPPSFNSGSKGGDELTSEGGTITTVTVDYPVISLNLYGKSVQDGTPTPDAPIDIVSVGDDGAVVITLNNGGDVTLSAEIKSALPLCSIGNVRDELIYNADGTGKIIKHTGKMVIDGINKKGYFMSYNEATSTIQWHSDFLPNLHINNDGKWGNGLCSHTGYSAVIDASYSHFAPTLDGGNMFMRCWFKDIGAKTTEELNVWLQSNPVTFIYQIEPQEIKLSSTEMAELMQLQTFDGVTNIYNDESAEMTVKVATNPMLSEYVMPVIEGITARYEERIAALEAAATSNN